MGQSPWAAITKLNNEVSTGRRAVKALVWVGSVILATVTARNVTATVAMLRFASPGAGRARRTILP
jgi:hypothetical protein